MSSGRPENAPQAGSRRKGNVFTIPPGAGFLRTLAESIINGDFCNNIDVAQDPMAYTDSVIYLPTRRSARALGGELLEAAKGKTGVATIMLPRIRTIGDLDEEEVYASLNTDAISELTDLKDAKKVINPVERRVQLAVLVKAWATNLSDQMRSMLGGETIAIPSSSADAYLLAKDLTGFIDQVETEGLDWKALAELGDDDRFSAWWDLTLDFLKIIMKAWPDYLQERNLVDPATFRNQVIDLRIEQLKRNPPGGLVLAAGTTGSIPATARLLQQIGKMPNGAIILPGFDQRIPVQTIAHIQRSEELHKEGVSSTFAQYGMIRLLDSLSYPHDEIRTLGNPKAHLVAREKIINQALLPAEETQGWLRLRQEMEDDQFAPALESLSLIEARNENEEATAIALVLREALATPDKTAALVTPDRKLARRVSTELERFGVRIDDTAGFALSMCGPAKYLRLLLRCVFDPYDPVVLSSFVKQDLNLTGPISVNDRSWLELFEIALIRDRISEPDLANLERELRRRRDDIAEAKHAPSNLRTLNEEAWSKLFELGRHFSRCLDNLVRLAEPETELSIDRLVTELLHCAKKLTENDDGISLLFEAEGGAELAALLDEYRQHGSANFLFDATEAVSMFDAMIAGNMARSTERTHPRLHIYGTLEARLQHADLMVLGGLNEGTWPQNSHNDPYLNRPMRSDLGLPLPERRIGLAAHDFSQLSGASEVYYSRSRRVDDTPTVASRWLQRLMTFLGEDKKKELVERGSRYIDLANQLGQSACDPVPIERPRPKPPVDKRPKRLSFTEIETWMRDPYSIYARHILKLRSLPDLSRSADPALKGTIYHGIVQKFIERWHGRITTEAHDKLAGIADEEFDLYDLPVEVLSVWRPRFDPVGRAFLDWEANRRDEVFASHCEVRIKGEIGSTGFILHGTADRIDIMNDGKLVVIDYKTGTYPNKKQARTLVPQLTLEGAMAARGCAEAIPPAAVGELYYVRLLEGERFNAEALGGGKGHKGEILSAGDYCILAHDNLVDLITEFGSSDRAYVSLNAPQPNKQYKGDYDHLARIAEWSIALGEGEGEQ